MQPENWTERSEGSANGELTTGYKILQLEVGNAGFEPASTGSKPDRISRLP